MEGVFPESGTQIRGQSLLEAQWVMARALQIGEWERGMDHRSLLPYLREEVAEFEQAVRELDDDASEENLLKELSDILLQVLFHAELARRRGSFDLDDVAAAFVSKMKSRAPYLFEEGDGIISIAEQERLWAEGKAQEKAQRPRE